MSHLSQILEAAANTAFRRKIESQRANAFPFLGMRYIECEVIDYFLRPSKTPLDYSVARGDYHAVETVSVFSFSHAAGLPVHAPKVTLSPEGNLTEASFSKEAREFYDRYNEAVSKLTEHRNTLRTEGCATASFYLHRAPAPSAEQGIVDQLCLYVPVSRVVAHDVVGAVLQPNTEDTVKFISYLARQGFISLDANAAEIIEATNARVLDLARQRQPVRGSNLTIK